MDHLPVFLSLQNRVVLVVGGGAIAQRKVELLLAARAQVHVVAPDVSAPLVALASAGKIQLTRAEFEPAHLEGVSLVIAATDVAEVNSAVSRIAQARGLWVNVVDDARASSFIVPAIVDRDPVTVAISTGGASPVLARRLRAAVEGALPQRVGELAALARRWRGRVADVFESVSSRRSFWEAFFRGPAAERVLAGQDPDPDASFAQVLARNSNDATGIVYLIGAGPGEAELLTLRAARLLSEADVVLYDRLVSPDVLARARRDAERVFVGKEAGNHHATQDEINALMLDYARQGLRVARLKGGDPFIFGRGGEELEVLRAAGIPVIIVPGISAGIGAAAQHGIPLTFRGLAESVTFVTAAGDAGESLNWTALAGPRQTIVFYMGVGQIERLVAELTAAGAPSSRAAAVVERATLPGERLLTGTLATIAAMTRSAGIVPPALLIVGDSVARGRSTEVAALGRHAA